MGILQGSSPLGLQLETNYSESKTRVGRYAVVGSTYSSLFSNGKFPKPDDVTSESLDISTTNIILRSQQYPAAKLNYADFAYLKNLGVYPNNRLIIARRFQSGVHDDLTTINLNDSTFTPMATLVSWVPDNENFISTEFGEEWDDAQATFKDILNDLGTDILMGDNRNKMLGNFLAGAGGSVTFPGFTEGLQYDILKNLGFTETDASKIPSGNPNLIREAKKRKTIGKSEAGSGLKCKFQVKMVVEYEQKFINGIDPTLVYYDIIANALTFGTSESQFQFSESVSSGLNEFLVNIGSGDSKKVKSAFVQFVSALGNALRKIGQQVLDGLKKLLSGDIQGIVSTVSNEILKGLVSKYKVRIMGVANALTGSPSAPWHVTIGNPNRPIFSSGDMLVEDVTITMGKLLSFNDLPSSIKLELTLKSARNLGAQEIYMKFNCGRQRSYVRKHRSFVETNLEISDNEINNASTNMRRNDINYGVVNSSDDKKGITGIDVDNKANQIVPSGIKKLNPEYLYASKDRNVLEIIPDLSSAGIEKGTKMFYDNGNGGRLVSKDNKLIGSWELDANDPSTTNIKGINGKVTAKIDKDGKIIKS